MNMIIMIMFILIIPILMKLDTLRKVAGQPKG